MPDTLPIAPPPGGPAPVGLTGWVGLVRGLTITNALVIILLAVVVIPGYILYRAVNDEKLLDRFMSNYQEISSQHSGCVERIAQMRGGSPFWSVSTGFAYQGTDRWTVSVWMDHDLSTDEFAIYCDSLKQVVEFMRDPDGASPMFPHSDDPIVRQYRKQKDDYGGPH